MAWYHVKDELPVWTDLAQAIIGTLGIAATVITLWKLMKKDKERESEIASLSVIANQLKDMMVLNERRYVESKTPNIVSDFTPTSTSNNGYKITLKNLNVSSRITSYELTAPDNSPISRSAILDEAGFQKIGFFIFMKDTYHTMITADFTVDKKYVYRQVYYFRKTNGEIEIQASTIVLIDSVVDKAL